VTARRIEPRGARTLRAALTASCAAAACWLVPGLALACPMCFGGNNMNQDAFLYGSLFLMVVPVAAIGSLLYWAYRRSRALEQPPRPPASGLTADGQGAAAPGLRVVRR
jgi:hypothetical protein